MSADGSKGDSTADVAMSPPKMTPGEYLAQHQITRYLKHLGVSDAQLDGVRFKQQDGCEFSAWVVYSPEVWPSNFERERQVWCALRWLILDDPPPSRDTQDAWNLLKDYHLEVTHPMRVQAAKITAERAAGIQLSAKARADTTRDRDRRIHDAGDAGKSGSEIADDMTIFPAAKSRSGKASRKYIKARINRQKLVSRVLSKPRP